MKLKLKSEKDKEILKEIKRVIIDVAKEMNIEIDKVILFGSRARGDYREDSDWDILVVTKRKLDKFSYFKFIRKITLILAKNGVDIQTLVIDKENFLRYSKSIGDIIYESAVKGVQI